MDSDQPTFRVGQVVVATGSYGWKLTEGKKYTVVEMTPPLHLPSFTFPEYTTVIGDHGEKVTGHSHRFRALKPDEVN